MANLTIEKKSTEKTALPREATKQIQKDHVFLLDYFAFDLGRDTGEAAKLLARLREERINLLAVNLFPRPDGRAQLDLVPESREEFLRAATDLALAPRSGKALFLLQGVDRAGVVADVLSKLSSAGVHVDAAQAACAGDGHYSLVFWVPQEQAAVAATTLGL